MKRFVLFCIFLAALVNACQPAADQTGRRGVPLGAVPPPTGTGLVTVTGGKQNAAALAGVDAGEILQWSGTAWAPIPLPASGGGAALLWSPADLGRLNGSSWGAGDWSAGRGIAVPDQNVTITGVRFWAKWTGSNRTIKARLCSCTSTTCASSASVATATASVSGAGAIATISFSSPQTLTASSTGIYVVSVYDTTATSYPIVPCPAALGGSGSCASIAYSLPLYADSTGMQLYMNKSYLASGDACATAVGGQVWNDEFYAVEPVVQ